MPTMKSIAPDTRKLGRNVTHVHLDTVYFRSNSVGHIAVINIWFNIDATAHLPVGIMA
jgi:hypothetical protein